MSVVQMDKTDSLPDEKLDLQYQADWSRMRSANAGREIFAYSVISDSGKLYETEVFVSDLGTICSYCSCPARVVCRHQKAVLADVIEKNPEFGKSVVEGEESK